MDRDELLDPGFCNSKCALWSPVSLKVSKTLLRLLPSLGTTGEAQRRESSCLLCSYGKNKEASASQETFYLCYFEFILTPEHLCNFFLLANGILTSKAAKSVQYYAFQEQRVTQQCYFKSSCGSVDFAKIQ